jgi:glycosyltransferase involved in cell wall biosynthesis
MISIIIPIYNQAKKLAKCLDSIATQTYKKYEIIVVDDGSTDNVKEVVEASKQKHSWTNIALIKQTNQGAPAARNRGAKQAKGDYFLFCDADITMDNQALEYLVESLEEHPEASYAYSSFKFGFKTFRLFPFDAEKLKQMPYIHTAALIRAKDFPGFDVSLKKFQDWDLWLTMLEQGHTGFWIDKILFKAAGGGTMSSWLPSFAYKLFPNNKNVKKYNEAKEIIIKKHNL